jgi:hypothetical protein
MVFRWLLVRQEYTGVMVKFDQNDRALYTEVKRVVFAEASNPTKVRFVDVLLDLFELELARLGWMIQQELLAYG